MTAFEPGDPDFEQRVRDSFARQTIMTTIGAELRSVAPGAVEIALPFHERNTQQHGFVHAGVVTTIADSACGYAALSLMAADSAVLTVEFKVNLLAPAVPPLLIARGRVERPGRTITVCRGSVFVVDGGEEKPVALIQATMMAVKDSGLKD
jgi:uncharacterized protein (TIGR00369 family)